MCPFIGIPIARFKILAIFPPAISWMQGTLVTVCRGTTCIRPTCVSTYIDKYMSMRNVFMIDVWLRRMFSYRMHDIAWKVFVHIYRLIGLQKMLSSTINKYKIYIVILIYLSRMFLYWLMEENIFFLENKHFIQQ